MTVAAGLALALLCGTGELRADIDPPAGLAWIKHVGVVVTNIEAFPDWVFVAWPCGWAAFSLEPYCILRPGQTDAAGTLYALAARDVKTREWKDDAPKDAAHREPDTLVFVQPKVENEQEFFARDKRVIRPGFALLPSWGTTTPSGLSIFAATYFVQLERVGAAGVEARFARAHFECWDGSSVDLDWGPKQDEPPVPSCPVTDDHSQLLGSGDGGSARGKSSDLAPALQRRFPLPAPRGHMMWLGVAIASVSLLTGGLLLRSKPKSTAKPPSEPPVS